MVKKPVNLRVRIKEGKMNIKSIKKEFGDCDWMRTFMNSYTVEAILWLISQVEELEKRRGVCPKCGEPYPVTHCENCGHNWEEN